MTFRPMSPHHASDFEFALAANAVATATEIACLNASGWAVPGSAATGLRAIGVFGRSESNAGGANGAKSVAVMTSHGKMGLRLFPLANSGTDPVVQATVGRSCFIEGPNTVAATDDGGTLSRAGKVWGFDKDGNVLVDFDGDYDAADIGAVEADVSALQSDVTDLQTDVAAIPTIRTGTLTLASGTQTVSLSGITSSSRIALGLTAVGAGAITGLAGFRIAKSADQFTVTAVDDSGATIATAACTLDYIAIG